MVTSTAASWCTGAILLADGAFAGAVCAPLLNERSIPKRVNWTGGSHYRILMPLLPPVEVTLFTPAGFWMRAAAADWRRDWSDHAAGFLPCGWPVR